MQCIMKTGVGFKPQATLLSKVCQSPRFRKFRFGARKDPREAPRENPYRASIRREHAHTARRDNIHTTFSTPSTNHQVQNMENVLEPISDMVTNRYTLGPRALQTLEKRRAHHFPNPRRLVSFPIGNQRTVFGGL